MTLVLLAHRKVICPVCTTDESKPVMFEEGREWEAHVRSKVHKHLAAAATAKDVGNGPVSATVSRIGQAPSAVTLQRMDPCRPDGPGVVVGRNYA